MIHALNRRMLTAPRSSYVKGYEPHSTLIPTEGASQASADLWNDIWAIVRRRTTQRSSLVWKLRVVQGVCDSEISESPCYNRWHERGFGEQGSWLDG